MQGVFDGTAHAALVGRLGQDAHGAGDAVAHHAGVGGHVEDGDAEVLAQFLAQSDAGGTIRQVNIDQGQFDAAAAGERTGGPGVRRGADDLIAEVLQYEAELHRHQGFIFDNQDTGGHWFRFRTGVCPLNASHRWRFT